MATNPPNISVVTAIYIEGEQVYDYALMTSQSGGKADCDFITQNPTQSPTTDPTSEPTTDPTAVPTGQPTKAPTYASWNIEDCTVTIPQYDSSSSKAIISAQFTYSKENDDAGASPKILLWVNGLSQTTTGLSESNTKTYADVSLDKSVIEEAMANDAFQAQIQYLQSEGSWTESNLTSCDFTSESPTTSPTKEPSKEPTSDPTRDPTTDPTAKPTMQPTPAPTFAGLVMGECTVEVSSDLSALAVTFVEAFYNESDSKYPTSTEVSYLITITDENTTASFYDVAASSSEETRVYAISDVDWFEIDSTLVMVEVFVDDGMESDDFSECELITQIPTVSPTTPSPTDYPTTDSPWITLDIDGDWGFDGGCVYPDDDRRRRIRRLQDSDTESDGNVTILVDEYCDTCPVCNVLENEDVKYIRISRTPADFQYDVIVRLKITYLDDTSGGGISKDDFDLDKIDDEWHDLVTSTGRYTEGYIIGASDGTSDGELVIPYYLSTSDEDGENAEAFMIEVTRCDVDESGGAVNAVPDGLTGVYTCNLGAYYPSVIVSIEDLVESGTFTEVEEEGWPLWVWIVIGVVAILIPILGYLIWRFWNAKKIADARERQKKYEIGEAELQDNVGHYGGVGDHVNANPLATGDAFEVPKGQAIIDHQLAIEKMNFEKATVVDEVNVFKQDFGQVVAERTRPSQMITAIDV